MTTTARRLTQKQVQVLAALTIGPLTLSQLQRRLGFDPHNALAQLVWLELVTRVQNPARVAGNGYLYLISEPAQ